jgi:formate-dependent nitrite reductase cytochrome c552 subunit
MSHERIGICRDTSLSLTYEKINETIKNCHEQKRERLKHKARDLKINPEWLSIAAFYHLPIANRMIIAWSN